MKRKSLVAGRAILYKGRLISGSLSAFFGFAILESSITDENYANVNNKFH